MQYKDARFVAQWLRGNGMWNMPNGAWWVKGKPAPALIAALKGYQANIGAPVTGTVNTATRNQMNYGLKILAGKNPSGTDAVTRQMVIDMYGPGLAAYMGHWELGPILTLAAKAGWDQARLNGAIQKTFWWKNTQQSSRDWDKLTVDEPGEMKAQLVAKANEMAILNKQLGLHVSGTGVFALARDALRYSWDDATIRQHLVAAMPKGNTGQVGQLQEITRQVTAGAAEYFVKYTPEHARNIAARIIAGSLRQESLEANWATQASSRFPSLAAQIRQGLKPSDYFASHTAAVAQTLEMSQDQIDLLNDKRWAPILESVDAKGKRRPMTIGEATTWARGTSLYHHTRAANENANAAVRALGSAFGKVAF